jgi:cytochrome c biogenesis protein
MALSLRKAFRDVWQTLSSIKTGVVLIILVVIFSAAGTVILQRPLTEPEDMQRVYSPQMLRILDAAGLTDVFHARWFVALMILVSLSIIAASVQRFPSSWRYFSRPYKSPSDNFGKALPTQAQIPVPDEETGLVAAERALHGMGFKPERIVRPGSFSLFAERNRISEMAVYIVHASLLLIFLGGIVDALYGWRGFLMLPQGQQSNEVGLRDGAKHILPFAVRCDAAGEDTYSDGSPKRWWSKLTVVKNGRDVLRKEIVVNDPLSYGGVRFYQSSYGSTGKVEHLILSATPVGSQGPREITLTRDQAFALDENTTVQLAEFIPDYVVSDGHIYARSNEVVNPAARLVVTSRKNRSSVSFWLPEIPGISENAKSPYLFEAKDLKLGYFTGLQVSRLPGQWAVWAGVIGMGIGLTFVFYVVHMRFWIVPVRDGRGRLVLWVGGTANRNRDVFEQKFLHLIKEIKEQLPVKSQAGGREPVATFAGR